MKPGVGLPLLFSLFALACTSENSSNKVAREQNVEKFNATSIRYDARFAERSTSSGYLEIELGKFAVTAAVSPKVREFGQTMAVAHNLGNEQLKKIAAAKNITLPSVPNNDKQKRMDNLKQKTGADFDKEYIDMMISYHKEDIEHCQREMDNGNDPEIKAWAEAMLPNLRHHLQMAKDIQKELNN